MVSLNVHWYKSGANSAFFCLVARLHTAALSMSVSKKCVHFGSPVTILHHEQIILRYRN